jgi:hypothetical protein
MLQQVGEPRAPVPLSAATEMDYEAMFCVDRLPDATSEELG